jgi:hypothetical protein
MALDMNTLIEELKRSAKERYQTSTLTQPNFNVNTRGSKYFKIEADGRIVCFVEKVTGNIYKPASWRGPYTKGVNSVRANIHDYETFMNKTDPFGAWLYV